MVAISGNRAVFFLLLLIAALASAAAPQSSYLQARVLYDRGDWKGLALFTDDALRTLPEASDEAAKLRVLRGAAYLLSKKEIATASVTPELPPALRNADVAVIRLRILGTLAYMDGHRDVEAAARMDEARTLALKRHPELVADAVVPRASMQRLYEAKGCEKYAKEALRYALRYKDSRSELGARGQLARVYGWQERYDEAVAAGEKALALATARQNESLQEAIAGNLGWFCVALGDGERAEQYLREALSIATKAGNVRNVASWRLQLGNIAMARGDHVTAGKEYREGLIAATQFSPDRRGGALANLASVAVETGQYDEARRYNNDALAAKREYKDAAGVQRSEILAARIDRETARLDEAKRGLDQVIAHPETRFIRLEAESELARVCVARHEGDAADKHFRDAMMMIDEARAEITTDELKLPFANVSAAVFHDYVDFLASAGRTRDALRVAELSRARTLAEGLGVDRDRSDEIDPERIAKSAGVTVLSYWLAPERSFLFVITPQGVQHFVLSAANVINAGIEAYQKDLTNVRRGSELYGTLVGPAAGAIRGNRVTIIPDGRLAAFNFETLRTPKGRYWIEDVTIESANALQFVTAAKKAERGRLLLIGNAPKADPQFPPLPHAAEEIRSIEKYFERHTTLEGAGATPSAYTGAKPESYAYVHFVAHGVAARQRPLDSAVILGRDANGYKLYARDVIDHPLKARLVTISSCHGAGKRAFAGEGLVGLAWAFLRAGAHEVVAALWEVNDASTVQLMDEMYASIHAGQAPVDALRAAKLKLLHSNGIYRKPQYWAPFVLYSGS